MSEKSIHLPIVFHFHQPVDNYNFVIEEVYEKSYEPLIDHIFKFSDIKVTLHFSGNLLEWFLNNKPEFIKKLKTMAKRRQIEIISGGYYEPIFAIIPYRDKIAQIKKLSDLIKKEFNLDVKFKKDTKKLSIFFTDYLHNAPTRYKEWKMINRDVENGYVQITHKDLARLIQESLRFRINKSSVQVNCYQLNHFLLSNI